MPTTLLGTTETLMHRPLRFPRWRHLVVTTVLLSLASGSGVASAQYGGTSGLVINPPVIISGDSIEMVGSGCQDDEQVNAVVPALGEIIGTTTAVGENGDFTMTNVVVIAPIPGIYPVEVTCGDLTLTAEVTVVDSEQERTARQQLIDEQEARDELDGPLALTGGTITTHIMRAAAAFLAVGAILALFGWRRRDEPEPSAS